MSSPDGPAVLLVEDDHGDAVLVQACLAEAGIAESQVHWVRTLADALICLTEMTPSCVLVDLGLPDASGYEVVRALVGAASDVAVIVLTGRQDRDGADALGAGAQDYLVKDAISAETLERSMRYAVERTRAQQAQQQLREARLNAAEQARLERGLLPTPVLRTDAVSCATYYRPGRDDAVLGGDFFDVLETPDGRVHAVIGDVMGHGADEAALGVHLRVAWRTLLLAGVEDAAILPNLDALLAADQSTGTRFVTVCDVVLDAGRASVRLAGHPAPILARDGKAGYPELTVGRPLGIRSMGDATDERWPITELDAPANTTLVLYTDGLLEAYDRGPSSSSLGIDELVSAVGVATATGNTAASWVSELVSGAPAEPLDDTAAVALTVRTLHG